MEAPPAEIPLTPSITRKRLTYSAAKPSPAQRRPVGRTPNCSTTTPALSGGSRRGRRTGRQLSRLVPHPFLPWQALREQRLLSFQQTPPIRRQLLGLAI